MQMEKSNNPTGTTLWGLKAEHEVPFEFLPKAAADLSLNIRGEGNPMSAKKLAAQRKVLAYFFIGFRPDCERAQLAAIPRTGKRTRLAVKAERASYDAFYRLVPSSGGDLKLATCEGV